MGSMQIGIYTTLTCFTVSAICVHILQCDLPGQVHEKHSALQKYILHQRLNIVI